MVDGFRRWWSVYWPAMLIGAVAGVLIGWMVVIMLMHMVPLAYAEVIRG